ncbi:MAG: M14 family metallopeptidase, partial [Desulfobacterales bacterium]
GGLPAVPAGERPRILRAACALALPPPPPATRRALLRRKRLPEETGDHLQALRTLPPGSGVLAGTLWVGKPRAARRALCRRAVQLLRDRGYRVGRLGVLHAYKPGLSWLLEEILPRLRRRKGIARLEIAFRPFEAGPDGLEMETRFLQEIYPGPDRLAKALRLPPKAVELLRAEGLAETYRVRAFDRSGRLLLEEGTTPLLSRRPVFPGRPEKGFVHPATGGIRLCRGGKPLLERPIATDRERFWDLFQREFLPALEREMEAGLAAGTQGRRVFWEEVRIEAAIAEEDRRVGVGEERISPLEALHEDLYFGLLDFHDDFCRAHGIAGGVSFGRIVPRIRRLAPGESPRAALRAIPAPPRPAEAPGPEPAAVRLGLEGGKLEALFAGVGLAGPRAEAFCRLGAAWGLGLRPDKDGRGVLGEVSLPRGPIPRPRPPAPRAPRPRLDRRVALAEIAREAAALGRLPAVRAFRAGESLQGRPIWALEIAGGAGGSLISHARRRLLRPTLLFNARHHANEVASTQAALRFAWELAATGPGRRALSRVNAVVIPLENPDGVALLEDLLPDCPGHKLHAARYNAAGVEWYADYFAPAPRFPEARAKAALWRRWLPLFVLDAHGVPAHEWDQPFAGNAPGRFRAYWIPRAFVYAILPFLENPGHPGHRRARAIARALGRALLADPRIAAREAEFRDRYRRYAHRWEPAVFPAPARRGLTVCATEERLAGLNFAARRFPVTVTEVVTEVADEVVGGRLLEDCGRAHLLAAWALIEEIARFAGGRLRRERLSGGGLRIAWRGKQGGGIARRGGGRAG